MLKHSDQKRLSPELEGNSVENILSVKCENILIEND